MPQPFDNTQWVRQLIHVPILHSPADMGTMGEKLVAAYIERFGRRHWEEYLAAIEGFWRNVRAELERLDLDYRQVDLYQDGLPVCGREMEIVRKAGATGSENYQLLLDLLAKGATLMGTEDPSLLLQEYHNIKTAVEGNPKDADKQADANVGLPVGAVGPSMKKSSGKPRVAVNPTLANRDAYIGRRIDETLRPGRTGILFLGMTHNVESYLPADIVVRRLARPG
jgi:hypothetical protein